MDDLPNALNGHTLRHPLTLGLKIKIHSCSMLKYGVYGRMYSIVVHVTCGSFIRYICVPIWPFCCADHVHIVYLLQQEIHYAELGSFKPQEPAQPKLTVAEKAATEEPVSPVCVCVGGGGG